jgi:hypothetical protein
MITAGQRNERWARAYELVLRAFRGYFIFSKSDTGNELMQLFKKVFRAKAFFSYEKNTKCLNPVPYLHFAEAHYHKQLFS